MTKYNNNLQSYIDSLFEMIIIGEQDYHLCLQELKQLWKINIYNFKNISDDKLRNLNIDKLAKESYSYIKQQNKQTAENLKVLDDVIKHVVKEIKKVISMPVSISLPVESEKHKKQALQSLENLRNDFGFQSILIYQPDNWEKILYWSNNIRKSMNKITKKFNLTKEELNINGQLSMKYHSSRISQLPQGITIDNKEGYFTIGIKNTEKKCFTAVLTHEYVHVFDRLAAKKYYQDKKCQLEEKDMYNCLSMVVIHNVLNKNNDVEDIFIKEFQSHIVKMISKEKESEISDNYMKKIDELRKPILELLMFNKYNNIREEMESHEEVMIKLKEEIYYWFIAGTKISEIAIRKFFESNYFHDRLKYDLNLSQKEINTLKKPNEELENRIMKEIKKILSKTNLCAVISTLSNFQGFLGSSPYMEKIIKHARKNQISLNYWTGIEEVLARHIEKTNKCNLSHLKKYEIFYPHLTNSEKKKYEQLFQLMVHYVHENKLEKKLAQINIKKKIAGSNSL